LLPSEFDFESFLTEAYFVASFGGTRSFITTLTGRALAIELAAVDGDFLMLLLFLSTTFFVEAAFFAGAVFFPVDLLVFAISVQIKSYQILLKLLT
jgi:hypothetical protein